MTVSSHTGVVIFKLAPAAPCTLICFRCFALTVCICLMRSESYSDPIDFPEAIHPAPPRSDVFQPRCHDCELACDWWYASPCVGAFCTVMHLQLTSYFMLLSGAPGAESPLSKLDLDPTVNSLPGSVAG